MNIDKIPAVGDGCTIYLWSDRHAATIVDVSGKRVYVQRDKAIRTDKNGQSERQSYTFERDLNAPVEVYSLRKNGNYVRVGDNLKDGLVLSIDGRYEYEDPSF